MTITAKVIAHSRPVWATDDSFDLFTMQLKYPRFIHSEFMTHRMFSRNASSSRAIPAHVQLARIKEDPVVPTYWGSKKKGMQAGKELEGQRLDSAKYTWLHTMELAHAGATTLDFLGLHKQIANRICEPWAHISVVVTATEWRNFFALRRHAAAQPEIRALADKMWEAQRASIPDIKAPAAPTDSPFDAHSGWHVPYVAKPSCGLHDQLQQAKVSTARCARVSYNRHDGTPATDEEDFELHDHLLKMGHMSPFEHSATPMPRGTLGEPNWPVGATHKDKEGEYWSGNFRGWIQYRQLLQ